MPIISTIGRKSLKIRILIGSIYGVLLVGAVAMVYPFLLMVAGTTKSNVDTPEAEIIPGYLADDAALYRKYAEALFNESSRVMNGCWNVQGTFRTVEFPPEGSPQLVAVWEQFLRDTPHDWHCWTLGFTGTVASRMVMPENLRRFRDSLSARFDGDLMRLNEAMGTKFMTWTSFRVPLQRFDQRRIQPVTGPFAEAFRTFAAECPLRQRVYFNAGRYFSTTFLTARYGNIEAYNAAHGTTAKDWGDVYLGRRAPSAPRQRENWEIFVRTILNLFWIRMDETEAPRFQAYLQAKYQTIGALNRAYNKDYADFGDVELSSVRPVASIEVADWDAFLRGWKDPETGALHQVVLKSLSIDSMDFRFRDYLQTCFADLDDLNRHCHTDFVSWDAVMPPQQAWHTQAFWGQTAHLRKEFTIRNFITVLDTVLFRGRAVFNTVVYCSLAILAALIVNPLAAYGLSRYKPPSAYKILLFMMLTMAFPPMVTQIPNFLLLRELGMLNTFWALILPGLANGYSIFLLKGFFDSLPKELYEAAEIDGASEFRIFWQLTMSLSTPILAVIALNAFTHAYSNFMMALLICQDNRMWTIMPWLYQLQQMSSQGVVYASLVIAAIPTFLVFVLCQNVIMRGIVVPVEK